MKHVADITVCVLLYGDHPRLAARCLQSIVDSADWDLVREIRVGLNEVSPRTRLELQRLPSSRSWIYEPVGGVNVWKYPLMRRMFHAETGPGPVGTSHIMWFDDDSAVQPGVSRGWWRRVANAARRCTMLGSVYTMAFQGEQWQAIQSQPWYAGRRPALNARRQPAYRFATGGWWVIRTDFVRQWDWPWPELRHNGGDRALGELCRQQGGTVQHFREGVWINADPEGRESKAPRRGVSQSALWQDMSADPPDITHQQFEIEVYRPGAA